MYLHNNIPTYNKNFNNLILKYDWDFFITLTYDTNRKSETIRNHIENIYNKNYWIEYLIWVNIKHFKKYSESSDIHISNTQMTEILMENIYSKIHTKITLIGICMDYKKQQKMRKNY